MKNSHHRLLATLLVAALTNVLEAAPQKRSCHFSPYSSSNSSLDVPPTASPWAPLSASDVDFTSDAPLTTIESTPVDTDAQTVPAATDGDPTASVPTLTTTNSNSTIGPPTITPKVVLIYPNSTYTVPSTISLSIPLPISAPQTTPAALNSPSLPPHAATTTTTTSSSSSTFTTPDIDAMQTAYYISVCGWPEHADDAICLGGNTMMCCRADNEHCQGILMDGGLSCQGIESGDWATTWARPTVTLGLDATGGIITPSGSDGAITAASTAVDPSVSSSGNEAPEAPTIPESTSSASAAASSATTKFRVGAASNSIGDGFRGGATSTTTTTTTSTTQSILEIQGATTSSSSSSPSSVSSTPTIIITDAPGISTTTTTTTTTPASTDSSAIIMIIPVDDDTVLHRRRGQR